MEIRFDGHLPLENLNQARQGQGAVNQSHNPAGEAEKAQFKSEFGDILKKAMHQDEDASVKLEQIRSEMANGELDSPEAARNAAINMLRFGI